MRFVMSDDWQEGAAALTGRLVSSLQGGQKVLWLVCGGSNIPAEAEIMKNIPVELTDNLSVALTDERYGEPGHEDSNWRQLQDAGFDFGRCLALPVLEAGKSLDETVRRYDELARKAIGENDKIIALFGIGADGHIAGILPGSPAAKEDQAWAAGYEAGPFTRITLTFPALEKIDAAYAFAFGDSKKDALHSLQVSDIGLAEQPSQILKQLPEAYLYSDQIQGETT